MRAGKLRKLQRQSQKSECARHGLACCRARAAVEVTDGAVSVASCSVFYDEYLYLRTKFNIPLLKLKGLFLNLNLVFELWQSWSCQLSDRRRGS